MSVQVLTELEYEYASSEPAFYARSHCANSEYLVPNTLPGFLYKNSESEDNQGEYDKHHYYHEEDVDRQTPVEFADGVCLCELFKKKCY